MQPKQPMVPIGSRSRSVPTHVRDFIQTLLTDSIKMGASDLHFESLEDGFRIRRRLEGEMTGIPCHAKIPGAAVIARLKVMANLDITESRVPQDGRFSFSVDDRSADIRVSCLPVQFGESVVLRILDSCDDRLHLDALGIPEGILKRIRKIMETPSGILLATGPTGSGKTTTLYSILKELNHSTKKLITAEDPVEYDLDGMVQVPVVPGIGLDFSTALRAFLRHDPDVILIGEIRDELSAEMAFQASLTGHLVLSSLHTNHAVGAIARLVDMGIEPYLVAAGLVAVIAQRLLRRLNPDNRKPYPPDRRLLNRLGLPPEYRHRFYEVADDSQKREYVGRIGLFEWLEIDDSMREAIIRGDSQAQMLGLAFESGMKSLRQQGILALERGDTTVKQVMRYT